MTYHSNDELISARLDDELSGEADRHVEELLREQTDARARLQSFADVDKLLRQSCDAINDTPAPYINSYTLAPETGSRKRTISLPFAAAASVIMLLTGTLAGIMTERLTAPEPVVLAQHQSNPTIATVASAAAPAVELSDALESNASGTTATLTPADSAGSALIEITRTWKLIDGRYCREYEISDKSVAQREVGVACREHSGEWRIRMRTYPDSTGTFL